MCASGQIKRVLFKCVQVGRSSVCKCVQVAGSRHIVSGWMGGRRSSLRCSASHDGDMRRIHP